MLNRTGSRIDPENPAFNLNTDYDSLIATLIKPIFHLDGRPTAQILTCHPACKDSTGDLIKTRAKVKMDLLQGRKLLPLIHLHDLFLINSHWPFAGALYLCIQKWLTTGFIL